MTSKKEALRQRRSHAVRLAEDTGAGNIQIRPVPPTVCGLGLAVLVWSSSMTGYAVQSVDSSGSEDQSLVHVVTGTLDQLDFEKGKGLLKTDLEKPVFFDIALPDLFRRLSIGQRVTIGINEQGQATKVMEIPPLELPPSEPHSPPR